MAAPMSIDDLEKKEEEEFRTGPLSVLTTSVKSNTQVRPGIGAFGSVAALPVAGPTRPMMATTRLEAPSWHAKLRLLLHDPELYEAGLR